MFAIEGYSHQGDCTEDRDYRRYIQMVSQSGKDIIKRKSLKKINMSRMLDKIDKNHPAPGRCWLSAHAISVGYRNA